MSPAWRWLPAAAVFLLYNSWLLWPLNGNPDVLAGYTSELASRDQPASWFFRTSDLLAGACFVLVGLLGRVRWRDWLPRGRSAVAASVVVAGVATVVDATFALPCAPSFDSACAAREAAAPFAPEFFVHTVASVTVFGAVLASMALAARAVGQTDLAQGRLMASVAVAYAALNGVDVAWQALGGLGHGYVQIVHVALAGAWMGLLAARTVVVGGPR